MGSSGLYPPCNIQVQDGLGRNCCVVGQNSGASTFYLADCGLFAKSHRTALGVSKQPLGNAGAHRTRILSHGQGGIRPLARTPTFGLPRAHRVPHEPAYSRETAPPPPKTNSRENGLTPSPLGVVPSSNKRLWI